MLIGPLPTISSHIQVFPFISIPTRDSLKIRNFLKCLCLLRSLVGIPHPFWCSIRCRHLIEARATFWTHSDFNKVMFPNKTRNLFLNKTRNLSLLSRWTVSARQGPVLGPARSILTGPGISLCSCPGLSLPDKPHSLVS